MPLRAVIDLNVLLVADKQHAPADPACILECVNRLEQLRDQDGAIILDDGWHILREYTRRLGDAQTPGIGAEFYRWVVTNLKNPVRCEQHPITPEADDSFVEFPKAIELAGFDRQDRKYAAVAVVSGAPVWNAVDSDWWEYRKPLAEHRIEVVFLCPDYFVAGDSD